MFTLENAGPSLNDAEGLPEKQDSRFEWSEAISVGNDALDEDHKAFFVLAKMLQEAQCSEDNVIVIGSALLILEEYVEGHFLREEKAMQAASYPRLADHAMKHSLFRSHVHAISSAYGQGTKSAVEGLPELVVDWLRRHIVAEDLQYKNWIRDAVVDRRPLAYLAIEAEE